MKIPKVELRHLSIAPPSSTKRAAGTKITTKATILMPSKQSRNRDRRSSNTEHRRIAQSVQVREVTMVTPNHLTSSNQYQLRAHRLRCLNHSPSSPLSISRIIAMEKKTKLIPTTEQRSRRSGGAIVITNNSAQGKLRQSQTLINTHISHHKVTV